MFIDYRDFTGEGPNAPTGGAVAFGDASSIAAQERQEAIKTRSSYRTRRQGLLGVFV